MRALQGWRVRTNARARAALGMAAMAACLTLAPPPARAQDVPDERLAEMKRQMNACVNDRDSYDAETAIAACAALIDSDLLSKDNLAVAYAARGAALDARGDHDQAIADFDQAIRLNPRDGFSYRARGDAYQAKGDVTHANADHARADKLSPP